MNNFFSFFFFYLLAVWFRWRLVMNCLSCCWCWKKRKQQLFSWKKKKNFFSLNFFSSYCFDRLIGRKAEKNTIWQIFHAQCCLNYFKNTTNKGSKTKFKLIYLPIYFFFSFVPCLQLIHLIPQNFSIFYTVEQNFWRFFFLGWGDKKRNKSWRVWWWSGGGWGKTGGGGEGGVGEGEGDKKAK